MTKKFLISIVLALNSSGLIFAQTPPLSPSQLLQSNVNLLQAIANQDNATAVVNFNTSVANAVLQLQSEGVVATPPPSFIVWETVDSTAAANVFNSLQSAFANSTSTAGINTISAITKSILPVPQIPGYEITVSVGTNGSPLFNFTPLTGIPNTPVVTPQPADPIGVAEGNGYYGCVTGDTTVAGTVVTDSRVTAKKFMAETPFGSACYWKQTSN